MQQMVVRLVQAVSSVMLEDLRLKQELKSSAMQDSTAWMPLPQSHAVVDTTAPQTQELKQFALMATTSLTYSSLSV